MAANIEPGVFDGLIPDTIGRIRPWNALEDCPGQQGESADKPVVGTRDDLTAQRAQPLINRRRGRNGILAAHKDSDRHARSGQFDASSPRHDARRWRDQHDLNHSRVVQGKLGGHPRPNRVADDDAARRTTGSEVMLHGG